MTLTQALAACGLTHRPTTPPNHRGAREVLDAEGRVVFVGHAEATGAWLRETGRYPWPETTDAR